MMLSLTAQAQKKCDWSDYSMFRSFQQGNYFEYRTNVHWDSCFDYVWLLYDYQLKKIDTLQEIASGAMHLQLNKKGKYQVQLKVSDRCNMCDTVFYNDITMTVYGPKTKLTYSSSINDCKSLTFEIQKIDTCIENYYEIWDANEFTKNLTDKQWKEMSDSMFYFTYDWNGKDLVYQAAQSKLKFEFKDSGRYLVLAYWINMCDRTDTFTFNKIVVCPKEQNLSVKNIVKDKEIKIIGYYDLLGRRVDYMEENKVYIIMYNNGKRQKVVKTR